ncbi:MAG: lysozyme inhibitor LprI family protein [Pseudomonadota bacterium]
MRWAALLLLAAPATAQDLVFSPAATEACLAQATSLDDQLTCAGTSANACMEATPGGYSTVGMGGCLDREYLWWDARLNASYQEALTAAKAVDADALPGPRGLPHAEASLRAMQRAWLPYRDALCAFEASKWGGGTGGGPAAIGCLLHETARQTLIIDQGWGL